MSQTESRNAHYSDQTGHAARGEYHKIKKELGQDPKSIPGFQSFTVSREWLVRRTMRRISRTGK